MQGTMAKSRQMSVSHRRSVVNRDTGAVELSGAGFSAPSDSSDDDSSD
jgi:hypothetical protein